MANSTENLAVTAASRLEEGTGPLALLPGVLLLLTVGYAGKSIEQGIARYGKAHHLVLPNIEYVLWAILLGALLTNTIGLPRIFRAGVATYEFWLKAGIILLGSRFILGDIARLGGISLLLVFACGQGLRSITPRRQPRPEHSTPTARANSPCSQKPAATRPSVLWCWATRFGGRARGLLPPLRSSSCATKQRFSGASSRNSCSASC